eukprot:gene1271-2457_t
MNFIFIYVFICTFILVESLMPLKIIKITRTFELLSSIPDTVDARLRLVVNGPSSNTALFRADVKKNLVFFRGCGSTYEEKGENSAEIIGEGKTTNLVKFLDWCQELASEASQVKSSFQSPKHDVKIVESEWLPFVGDIKGFVTKTAAPSLGDPSGQKDRLEASTMAGTDESNLYSNAVSSLRVHGDKIEILAKKIAKGMLKHAP